MTCDAIPSMSLFLAVKRCNRFQIFRCKENLYLSYTLRVRMRTYVFK